MLYLRTRGALLEVINRYDHSGDPEGALHETWVRILIELPSFRGLAGWRAWARTIAFRVAMQQRRLLTRDGDLTLVPTPPRLLVKLSPTTPSTAEATVELAEIVRLLWRLPPRHCETLAVHAIGGRLDCLPATALTRRFYARQQLLELMDHPNALPPSLARRQRSQEARRRARDRLEPSTA